MGQWEALRNRKGGTMCCNIGRKGTAFLKERQHVEGATERKLIDGSVQREQKTEISQCISQKTLELPGFGLSLMDQLV